MTDNCNIKLTVTFMMQSGIKQESFNAAFHSNALPLSQASPNVCNGYLYTFAYRPLGTLKETILLCGLDNTFAIFGKI